MWASYFSDCEQVINAINKYLEAGKTGKSSIMIPSFHKDSVIFEGGKNEVGTHQIQGFFDLINTCGQDPNPQPPHQISILDITKTTAVTRTVMEFHGTTYTDYHSLIKTPEGWLIVAKVYHTHTH